MTRTDDLYVYQSNSSAGTQLSALGTKQLLAPLCYESLDRGESGDKSIMATWFSVLPEQPINITLFKVHDIHIIHAPVRVQTTQPPEIERLPAAWKILGTLRHSRSLHTLHV